MIGQVNKYYLKDWKDPIMGRAIAENESWILVQYIPVDYVIDGYKILKKSFIDKIERTASEEKVERVIKLRRTTSTLPEGFYFGTTIELLNWIEKTYGLFEFQDSEEGAVMMGKVKQILEDNYLLIDFIGAEGKIVEDYDYEFEIAEIRTLTFETDYFNAIRLLWKDNLDLKEN